MRSTDILVSTTRVWSDNVSEQTSIGLEQINDPLQDQLMSAGDKICHRTLPVSDCGEKYGTVFCNCFGKLVLKYGCELDIGVWCEQVRLWCIIGSKSLQYFLEERFEIDVKNDDFEQKNYTDKNDVYFVTTFCFRELFFESCLFDSDHWSPIKICLGLMTVSFTTSTTFLSYHEQSPM